VARASRAKTTNRPDGGTSSRSKREDILASAAEHFGRQGYEDTKWADIASDVGVGSTALYHYFESKLHCLFEILSDTLASFAVMFDAITESHDRFENGLVALLHSNFDLTEAQVSCCRVLVAEQGRVGQARRTVREEEARQRARELLRERDLEWSNYLARGMATGAIPEANPELLTRAVLGLYSSVWHWYHPGGALSLPQVEAFYVPRILAVVGIGEATAATA
jgi:TetR/AcrR family transcriptional regulator, cholesterol catabolism regulator